MIFCGERARIFAALFGQNERGVGLIIAETRVGRGRDLAGLRQGSRGEGVRQFPCEKCLKSFHALAAPAVRIAIGRDYSPRLSRAATAYFCERSRKIARISSADWALARLSRTLRSFRNFAMEASVRRWV